MSIKSIICDFDSKGNAKAPKVQWQYLTEKQRAVCAVGVVENDDEMDDRKRKGRARKSKQRIGTFTEPATFTRTRTHTHNHTATASVNPAVCATKPVPMTEPKPMLPQLQYVHGHGHDHEHVHPRHPLSHSPCYHQHHHPARVIASPYFAVPAVPPATASTGSHQSGPIYSAAAAQSGVFWRPQQLPVNPAMTSLPTSSHSALALWRPSTAAAPASLSRPRMMTMMMPPPHSPSSMMSSARSLLSSSSSSTGGGYSHSVTTLSSLPSLPVSKPMRTVSRSAHSHLSNGNSSSSSSNRGASKSRQACAETGAPVLGGSSSSSCSSSSPLTGGMQVRMKMPLAFPKLAGATARKRKKAGTSLIDHNETGASNAVILPLSTSVPMPPLKRQREKYVKILSKKRNFLDDFRNCNCKCNCIANQMIGNDTSVELPATFCKVFEHTVYVCSKPLLYLGQ